MQKRHEWIESPQLERRIHLWCYGSYGSPVLVFPSAAGMAHEWEMQGMIDVLAPMLDAGEIKLYCPESNVGETWTAKGDDPRRRIALHMAYECFVVDTLVPLIREDCRTLDIRLGVTGCSVGAFFAANAALKHPEIFHYALCMSGLYDASDFTGGFSNDDLYFNNPLAYPAHLEGAALERVRSNTHLALVCGRGAFEDGNVEQTEALARILSSKGISNELDLWGLDTDHGWDSWKKQAQYHLGKTFAGRG